MRVTWLDRAIAKVSPKVAIRRVRQRAAFDSVARLYEGASRDRRTAGWQSVNTSADAEIAVAGATLRSRMRDLVRNNPHAARAVSAWETNLIGDGIEARIRNERNKKAWQKWCRRCDADNQLDFNGLQGLAIREVVEAGEVLIRRRWRRRSDGVPGAMQIQILEADHLDGDKTEALASGGYIINGVEFDQIGRRVAYWLFPQHPGALATLQKTSIVSQRVSARDVIHLYRKQRTQVRGVPWGAPIISDLRDLSEYERAELMRKRIESCMVGVLVNESEDDLGIGIETDARESEPSPGFYDQQGVQVDQFAPGMFAIARGAKDVKFNQPASTGSYEGFRRASLMTVAAGFDLPYAVLSGDLTAVNYSSIRAGLVEFRRIVQKLQWQMVIPTLCEGVLAWFIEAHEQIGEIDPMSVEDVTWVPPKFIWIDPLKDATADLLSIRAGIRTWDEVVAEQGRDPDQVVAEIAARNKSLDAAGIVLDSDPRQTAKNGGLQIAVNTGDPPAEDKGA